MKNLIWDLLDSLVEEYEYTISLNHKTAHAKVMLRGLSDGRVSLYISEINSDNKGTGDGSELLDMIRNYSDFNNIPVSLFAVSDNQNFDNQKRLERWYCRNGFESRSDLDLEDSEFMFPLMVYNS